MPKYVPIIVGILVSFLGGCSGLVKGLVDTQPRSSLSADDLEHPERVVNGRAIGYFPLGKRAQEDADTIDQDIVRYAPVIVQGFQPTDRKRASYPVTDDAIGSPYLAAGGERVRVNTDRPELYWRIEHAEVEGQPLKQLVYVFWYPRRPVGTIETGSIDGGVLRITLDTDGRPAVYEYAQTCGCYHGVFVSADVERNAQRQFSTIEKHREHAVEPPITGKDDWVVRDVIDARPGTRPVLFVSTGKHFLVDIASLEPDRVRSIVGEQARGYRLAAYDTLEAVPVSGGGKGSIFNAEGLVKGAKRKGEELVLGDLDHPGWPRRLDKMHIHWDKEEWSDPTLLAQHLRLPESVIKHQARTATGPAGDAPRRESRLVSVSRHQSVRKPHASGTSDGACSRQLLLFTDARCNGCQLTKEIIKDSDKIRDALGDWSLTIIDTSTEEGARLAAEHRVSLVPTIVGVENNKELMRSDQLETEGKILRAINQIKHARAQS